MRGSRRANCREMGRRGPIPAHAGQPSTRTSRVSTGRAYPRACGAARHWDQRPAAGWGLSPRMRGSLICMRSATTIAGPIPAHAGQPRALARKVPASRAYPRACGAARSSALMMVTPAGLSPRMRGSRRTVDDREQASGPIPAHAGQPATRTPLALFIRAYPRACGAARRPVKRSRRCLGLSPRMRGSLWRVSRYLCCEGPIPAHAGQPRP